MRRVSGPALSKGIYTTVPWRRMSKLVHWKIMSLLQHWRASPLEKGATLWEGMAG